MFSRDIGCLVTESGWDAAIMYECMICHQHAQTTLAGVLRHIREVHPHFQGSVPCGIQGCPSTPTSYEGLRQHVYR